LRPEVEVGKGETRGARSRRFGFRGVGRKCSELERSRVGSVSPWIARGFCAT
jgi:hypothetical protein